MTNESIRARSEERPSVGRTAQAHNGMPGDTDVPLSTRDVKRSFASSAGEAAGEAPPGAAAEAPLGAGADGEAATGDPPGPSAEELAQAAAKVRQQRVQLQEDFEKVRLRAEEQRVIWPRRAQRDVLAAALTVLDDLLRCLEAAPPPARCSKLTFQTFREGAALVCSSMAEMLARFSMEPVAAPKDAAPKAQGPDVPPAEDGLAVLEHERIRLRMTASAYKAYNRQVKAERAYAEYAARAAVVGALQSVLKQFEEGLQGATDGASEEVCAQLTYAAKEVSGQFLDALASFDVKPMSVLSAAFAVDQHEAVGQAPADGHRAGTVIYEVRRGYMMGNQVLRYAQVIVAQ